MIFVRRRNQFTKRWCFYYGHLNCAVEEALQPKARKSDRYTKREVKRAVMKNEEINRGAGVNRVKNKYWNVLKVLLSVNQLGMSRSYKGPVRDTKEVPGSTKSANQNNRTE